MKIKGWEKISGFTYKGYTIVNPIHNAQETSYNATVLNLNLPQKPKWELSVLTPKHKFKQDNDFSIILRDDENRSTIHTIDKVCMASISIFRQTFEEMVDKILVLQLTSAVAYSSHYSKTINPNLYGTININNSSANGILNTITANSNTITWNPTTNLPISSSMVMAIKDLQEQIDNLKNNNVNNK